jgi:predicted molibdopterin-dependent oxidoreductase YjgC
VVGVRRAGLVPDEGGLDGGAMLDATFKGQIKLLYIAANNPLHHAPDYDAARRALETADFVIVQTLFENEVTEHADVVLPAASFLEKDGTTTNFHGKVQNLKMVFKPRERRDDRGNALAACAPDWVIFTRIAQLLEANWNITNAQQWTQQWRALSAPTNAQLRFAPVTYDASPATLPAGTLRLLTGNLLYDGGESFNYCERLKLVVPQPFVHINRADGRRLGIENNALVEVKSARGAAQVRARLGRQVKEGTVWMPRRLWDVRLNRIVELDKPFTAVTLTKLEDAPPAAQTLADGHAVGVAQAVPVTV